jgi:hypothetical protein
MRKLKLDPDTLHVQSFAADAGAEAAKGTVHARSWYVTVDPYQNACGSDGGSVNCQDTDYKVYTCGNSCINYCHLTGDDPTCIN